jgi:hypothetical protein
MQAGITNIPSLYVLVWRYLFIVIVYLSTSTS